MRRIYKLFAFAFLLSAPLLIPAQALANQQQKKGNEKNINDSSMGTEIKTDTVEQDSIGRVDTCTCGCPYSNQTNNPADTTSNQELSENDSDSHTLSKTLIIAITAIGSLLIGFLAGWFSYKTFKSKNQNRKKEWKPKFVFVRNESKEVMSTSSSPKDDKKHNSKGKSKTNRKKM